MSAANGRTTKRTSAKKAPAAKTAAAQGDLEARLDQLERSHKAVKSRVDKLEHDRNLLAWLYAELLHGLRMAAVQQLLQQPEIKQALQQQSLQQELIKKMMTGAGQ